ncbi:hypothetical protein N431DRAFT_463182 [Stipitochalara longipes BDJ]|nr:hypothetical protein N431DRAFT_463182 [Stipitochalara longipes BDJ]
MQDKPSISLRKYIKWGDNPPAEPTSTLVLTSPQRHFIDVRINLLKPDNESIPFENDPLSLSTPIVETSRLEWAFAGTSFSTPASKGKPAHTVWRHWVDSKTSAADSVIDEGDMFPQANGEVLECGTMIHPATNKIEAYEECWVELPLSVDWCSEGNAEWEGLRRGLVVRIDDEKGLKGLIVRIGGWMQAVLRRGEDVQIARWKYAGDDVGWERVVHIGNVLDWDRVEEMIRIIENKVVTDGPFEHGNRFEIGDWEVVEDFTWD